MYKTLSPEDITTDAMPVVEPAGSDPGGLLVENTDYKITAFNLGEFGYRQLFSIIRGSRSFTSPPFEGLITVAIINRKNFKESIHPSSFEVGGIKVKTGFSDVNHCEAGREYIAVDGSYYLYPDIGIIIKSGLVTPFGTIKACSEETITNTHVHIYAGPSEFNYSTNPSYMDNNDNLRFPTYDRFRGPYNTGYEDWINNPITYITGIGLYNDNGDCLAVVKLPKPIKKDFSTPFSTTIELKF
jgi:hypothetical protein